MRVENYTDLLFVDNDLPSTIRKIKELRGLET